MYFKRGIDYFHDHLNGYVVGNDGSLTNPDGIILRSKNASLISNSTILSGITWDEKDITDKLNITSNADASINAIAFASRYNGIWGGTYNITNSTQYPYARLIRDESELFSTYFFYDKLGRIVVSQNTKQFNGSGSSSGSSSMRYSYTLYDELGRVVEAGEKTENSGSSSSSFADVFGTTIANHFNPKVIDDAKLNLWLVDNSGARKEVTQSYYDKTVIAGLPVDFIPDVQTQRKRITHVTYEDVFDGNDQTYEHATHYDYDIHGNVKTLIQDNQKLATSGTYMGTGGSSSVVVATERFKRLDYNYDLISGNVHSVSYQNGEADAWHHAYEYDADNRITNVYTTTAANTGTSLETVNNQGNIINDVMDNHLWDNDSRYEYYAHGPMSRVELGDNQVQGNDYIYTLQGWIKGVNSNTLNTTNDPGGDGTGINATNVNALFARDVYGYSLNYFTGDYAAIDATKNTNTNSFTASISSSDVENNRFDLFNGNIGSMVTTITDAANPTAPITPSTPFTRAVLPLGNAYKYDQLNRLLQAVSYNNLDLNPASGTYNEFGLGGTQMYYNSFEYDANGNIKKQQRADHTNTVFDDLEYKYAENASGKIQNRLYHVIENPALTALYTDDMEDQGTFDPTLATINDNNNYGFDEIGNLIRDDKEGIELITWYMDGRISEIKMSSASGKPNLKFEYNAMGLRIAKHKYNQSFGHISSEYYVHDASGNIMAVYENKMEGIQASQKLVELDIYGSGKIGVVKPDVQMIAAIVDDDTYSRTLGKKTYFLSNHLGNNITSIADIKIPIENTSTLGEVEYYIVKIESAVDYSAFGCELYDRKFSTSAMAYGFSGQRKDNEIYGEGNSYTAEFWQYDPRLGRRWNIDPVVYSWQSSYSVFNNNPIIFSDPLGREGKNKVKTDKVQKGEGAWSVATRNKISTEQLVKWNEDIFPEGLKSGTYMLHPGQVLKVSDPQLSSEAKPAAKQLSTETNVAQQPNKVFTPKTITVKDGTDASSLGIVNKALPKPKRGGKPKIGDTPMIVDWAGKYGSEKVDEAHTNDENQTELANAMLAFEGNIPNVYTEKEPHTNPFYIPYKGPIEPMPVKKVIFGYSDTVESYSPYWGKIFNVDTNLYTNYGTDTYTVEVLDSNKNSLYEPEYQNPRKK